MIRFSDLPAILITSGAVLLLFTVAYRVVAWLDDKLIEPWRMRHATPLEDYPDGESG